jgi:GTP-binding protein
MVDTAGLRTCSTVARGACASRPGAIRRLTSPLLLFDARAGITPLDEHFAKRLRKTKPILLVANKCESRAAEAGLNEAFRPARRAAPTRRAWRGHGYAL